MSRVGKKPIVVPSGVEVTVNGVRFYFQIYANTKTHFQLRT